MKFEISNNKLEHVVFKYLDNMKLIIKETDSNYYFLDKDIGYLKISYIKSRYMCLITYELFGEIRSFFTIYDTKKIKDIITKYVENKLNVSVSQTVIN